jgi:hypothetical protein
MIGRDAVADETERGRHPLEQVDGDTGLDGHCGFQQRVGGVDSGGAGSDNGYPQRARHDQIPFEQGQGTRREA